MKMQALEEKSHKLEKLTVAFDIGQEKLNSYFSCELNGKLYSFEDEFANHSTEILRHLKNMMFFARTKLQKELCVVCEPTGGYERKLLKIASELDIERVYVNGEAVCKLKIMENNSSGKSDIKDPRVISMVHDCGKSFLIRDFNNFYNRLRQLNESYDHFRDNKKIAKCRLHHIIKKLFGDLSFKSDFYYQKTGRALIEIFNMNPQKILLAGRKKFERKMRQAVPRIRTKTLERLWNDAESSELFAWEPGEREIIVHELVMTWEEFLLFEKDKEVIREKIVATYRQLRLFDNSIPNSFHQVVSEFSMGRILGETGPLDDFKSNRQLLKYAGLNIREKQSGKFSGKNRIDKKGRSRLRNILHMATLPLIANGKAFAKEYKLKKERMEAGKAQIALTRKLLKVIHGLNKNKYGFSSERLFLCESEYKKEQEKKVA